MTSFDAPTTRNVACAHVRAAHKHGTYACYVLDGCRCDECRPVAVAYRRQESRLKNHRQWATDDHLDPYVDASAATAHVRELQAAGLGFKEIADRAGVARSSVGAMLWATPARGRGVREKVTRATRDALLAVPVPSLEQLRAGQKITSIPTVNRVRALGRMGYSAGRIARAAGLDRQPIDRAMRGAPAVAVRTHTAVRKAFTALWMQPCEPEEWRAKIAASRTRRRADELGWPSPLDLDGDGYLEHDDVEEDAA